MNRRAFVAGLAASLAAPLAVQGQQAGKIYRIGVLMNLYSPDADPPRALRQRLRDLGYLEGQNSSSIGDISWARPTGFPR